VLNNKSEGYVMNGNLILLIIAILDIVIVGLIVFWVLRQRSNYANLIVKNGWLNGTFSTISEAVAFTDKKNRIAYSNNAFSEVFEIEKIDIEHKKINDLIEAHTIFKKSKLVNFNELLEAKSEHSFKAYIIIKSSGCKKMVICQVKPIRTGKNKVIGNIIIFKDITESKNKEDKIHEISYYDEITGMPNKLFFTEMVKSSINNTKTDNKLLAVVLVDIDNFMTINDSIGHSHGDDFLKIAGVKMSEVLRDEDFIARIGGDEFGILLPNITKLNDITGIIDRLMGVFNKHWKIEEQEFFITVSIGIAVCPFDGKELGVLVKNADTAMNKAKELGKNNYKFFTKSMNERIIEKLDSEKRLRYAVKSNFFEVYYQPQIDIKTMEISGAEALVRWIDPERGIISPMDFIPLAEETGLINELGRWVLKTACKQIKEWENKGHKKISIAVNLSTKQLLQQELVSIIKEILDEANLEPSRLEIEITETIAMKNIDTAMYILKDLKKMGIKISLDDFGTGYSSLNYLKILAIDYLKIDKSFITDIQESESQGEIAKAVITLAHGVNLEVIAEGVETVEQLEFLRKFNCDKFQGYWYSPPVPAKEFEKLLIKEKSKDYAN
jgi:polar amino acid transport system substrate-binding protein